MWLKNPMNALVHTAAIAMVVGMLNLGDTAGAAIIAGTACNSYDPPERLFDCLAALIQQPMVLEILQRAAAACLQDTGAVTKQCVGRFIANTINKDAIAPPTARPPSADDRRASAAAYAFCRHLGEKTKAYSDCYSATMMRLRLPANGPSPRGSAQLPAPAPPPSQPPRTTASQCDPMFVAEALRRARPGADPGTVWRATMMLLEAYGCIGRSP